MAHLHLFNPENDLALADGGRFYTPPPLARAIARDLSTLPLWYARQGDVVCLPAPDFAASLDVSPALLGQSCRVCSPKRLAGDVDGYTPWGWSREVAQRLLRYGADPALLPSDTMLQCQREWSHRIRTREVFEYLENCSVDLPDEWPTLFSDEESVARFVSAHERTMLKAPWSGSGKGLCRTRGVYDLVTARWTQGVLRRQGEVVGEPFWDKESDMAMEFYSDGDRVVFAGYSWFTTDERGAYKGNLLLSDTAIEARISTRLDIGAVRRVRDCLETFFTRRLAPVYRGYFGVDMMIYRHAGTWALHPCVEINLRMNMGMVSRLFYDRYVAAGSEGLYRVDYFPDAGQLLADHRRRQAEAPLCIDGTRLTSGYLSLNPIGPDTRYRASVEVWPSVAGDGV